MIIVGNSSKTLCVQFRGHWDERGGTTPSPFMSSHLQFVCWMHDHYDQSLSRPLNLPRCFWPKVPIICREQKSNRKDKQLQLNGDVLNGERKSEWDWWCCSCLYLESSEVSCCHESGLTLPPTPTTYKYRDLIIRHENRSLTHSHNSQLQKCTPTGSEKNSKFISWHLLLSSCLLFLMIKQSNFSVQISQIIQSKVHQSRHWEIL